MTYRADNTLIKVMFISALLGALLGFSIVVELAPEEVSQAITKFERVGGSE